MGLKARIAVGGLAIAAAGLGFIGAQEGVTTRAIPDPFLGWSVPTICHGHTGPDVNKGTVASPAMCDDLLRSDAARDLQTLSECITNRKLNTNQVTAILSLAINVGAGKVCASTLVRLVNQDKLPQAAQQFPRWDLVKGRPSQSLRKRRLREQHLFLDPVLLPDQLPPQYLP